MKLTLLELTIRNFLSYGNVPVTLKLNEPIATLIVGEDLDNTSEGRRSNGVGKTSIINAIAYALYGKPIADISVDNLVNNINKKELEVTLTFEVDQIRYRVYRCRKMKGKADVSLEQWIGDSWTDITIAGNLNEYVASKIGMPFELFERIVIFTASHKSFLSLPSRSASGTNQSDFMEELFGFTILSQKAEALKKIIKDTEQQLEVIQAKLDGQAQAEQRHIQQINNMKAKVVAWEQSREEQIATWTQNLTKYQNIDIEGQKALFDVVDSLNKEIVEINREIQTIDNDIKTLNAEVKTIENGERLQLNKKTTAEKQISSSQQNLKHLNDSTCPYCKQSYEDTGDKIAVCQHDIDQASNEIATINVEIETLIAGKQELQTLLNQLALDRKPFVDKIQQLTKDIKATQGQIVVSGRDQIEHVKSNMATLHSKIEDLEKASNPLLDSLTELEDEKFETVDYSQANEISKVLEHQKFLLKLLTKKDSFVRRTLLNKNIPFLNQQLQQYISDMGLSHRVEFTHDMNAKITQFGRDLDKGNLSAGQAARVNFALSVAFRDVKQSLHGSVNMWMLDEILDVGMDSAGVQAAVKILKRKAKQEQLSLFVISHREEVEGMFEKIMTIQMKDGFSNVK